MKFLKFGKNNLLSILLFIFLLTNNIIIVSKRLSKKKANKLQAASVSTNKNKNNDIEYFNIVKNFLIKKNLKCKESSTCKSKVESLIDYTKLNDDFLFLLEILKINDNENEYNEFNVGNAKCLFNKISYLLNSRPHKITEYNIILNYFKDLINIVFIYPNFADYLENEHKKLNKENSKGSFKVKALFIVKMLRFINIKLKLHKKSCKSLDKAYSIVNINNDCKFLAELKKKSKKKYLLINAPIELSSDENYNNFKNNLSSLGKYKYMLMTILDFNLCESIDINNAKSTIIKPFTLFKIIKITKVNNNIEVKLRCLKNDVKNIEEFKKDIIISSIN